MKMSYGGGDDTVVMDLVTNTTFSYEKDTDYLHQIYGGRKYYESGTGLTGAGFLKEHDSLIELGTYRIDVSKNDPYACWKTIRMLDWQELYALAPIKNHGGIRHGYPFVVTDKNRVVFCKEHNLKKTIQNFTDQDFKPMNFSWFDKDGFERIYNWKFINDGFSGVNALKFLDLDVEGLSPKIGDDSEINDWCYNNNDPFSKKIGIVSSWNHEGLQGLYHPLGFICQVWKYFDDDPLEPGKKLAGWNIEENRIWRKISKSRYSGDYPKVQIVYKDGVEDEISIFDFDFNPV